MANSMFRVVIPKNPAKLLHLASDILKKHTALGKDSPLNAMVAHKWSDNGPKVAECQAKHQQAEALMKQALQAYAERDLLLSHITETVKASRDLLLGVYRGTPKSLGEYGFDVYDTTRTK